MLGDDKNVITTRHLSSASLGHCLLSPSPWIVTHDFLDESWGELQGLLGVAHPIQVSSWRTCTNKEKVPENKVLSRSYYFTVFGSVCCDFLLLTDGGRSVINTCAVVEHDLGYSEHLLLNHYLICVPSPTSWSQLGGGNNRNYLLSPLYFVKLLSRGTSDRLWGHKDL